MTKRLRILHVMRAPVGGLFRHVLDLAGYQTSQGHDVGILADGNAGDALTDAKFAGVDPALALGVTRVAMSRMPGLGDWVALNAVIEHAAPLKLDVLHGHGAKGGAYARLAANRLRKRGQAVKCFYTPHGGSLHYAPETLAGRVIAAAERRLAAFTDGIIFESGYAARLYEARFGFGKTAHRVIPNGLKPDDFAAAVPAADAAEFLYVGELRALKGIDILLEALADVHRERPVSAVIVGSGPDGDMLKAQAGALGLAKAIRFAGAIPARQAFTLGRVLVVPSRAESFPYIVLEAAAAGLAMIATNVGGIPEIVAGTSARLVAPGHVSALSDRLRLARTGDPALQIATQELKNAVAENFTVAAMGAEVLDFYQQSRA